MARPDPPAVAMESPLMAIDLGEAMGRLDSHPEFVTCLSVMVSSLFVGPFLKGQ